ncbi:hypothetical protein KJS94_03595 [Flavihumibacter rivuli]|uniref:DUF6702 family protein n=1 Tax=Flavihumibacter rivuli TaxID=2838156 RepID=UPI001BDDD45D|nr:DUF6702 family protein [Flavihumibacter rivuli]ULQ57283.1 hypothetical protein KJS94_03595 [Flavihumibacter rivuli]
MAGLVSLFHPFYVGVTEINHNAGEKTLEISVKLFVDDFESALKKSNNAIVDLAQPKDKAATDQMITRYLQQHIQLKVNGKPVSLEYIGYEKEREAAWCYVQVGNIPSVSKLEINNSLLYDSYDKQINIMHVTVNGQRKSNKLVYPDTKTIFEF